MVFAPTAEEERRPIAATFSSDLLRGVFAMRRFILTTVSALTISTAEAQTIYNVDINSIPTTGSSAFLGYNPYFGPPPTGGGYYVAGSSGSGGSTLIYATITPLYNLSLLGLPAGSEVNLGTLDVRPVYIYDQYGDESYAPPTYALSVIPLFLGGDYPYCTLALIALGCRLVVPPDAIVPLIFPSDASVQFSFVDGTIIPTVAAVPEPSTWAMLLIGFVAIGFAAYRKATMKI